MAKLKLPPLLLIIASIAIACTSPTSKRVGSTPVSQAKFDKLLEYTQSSGFGGVLGCSTEECTILLSDFKSHETWTIPIEYDTITDVFALDIPDAITQKIDSKCESICLNKGDDSDLYYHKYRGQIIVVKYENELCMTDEKMTKICIPKNEDGNSYLLMLVPRIVE